MTDIRIFDRTLLRQRRARCAGCFNDYDFLFQWSANNLRDRLADIKRDFKTALQIGGRGGAVVPQAIITDISPAFAPAIIADEEYLPLRDASLDLALSNLNLHAVNDLPGTLLQIRKSLKPDGLFLAAMFGGETLHQLRASLLHAEMTVHGGASPRVFPFADKQDMGALMQRAGFALPVIDSDTVTVSYENIFKLMTDLRGMGESNIIAKRARRTPGKAFFMEAAKHYQENFSEKDGRIAATFEIIFLLGWAPHDSQQKPLPRGSATMPLADVLK
ncbi:MAG: methyltransferase domain-containing protein [Bdellovibrionales bacterium]